MIAGHLGIALGARRYTRAVPLWLLLFAAELPDWVDAGVCIVSPRSFQGEIWSHSIPAIFALALTLSALYALYNRTLQGTLPLALLVFSHALADYFTALKPTWPGGPLFGMGLYNHPLGDAALEVVVVIVGWLLYRQTIPEENRSSWLARLPLILLIGGQLTLMVAAFLGATPSKC